MDRIERAWRDARAAVAALRIVRLILAQHWTPTGETQCACWVCRQAKASGIQSADWLAAGRLGRVWVDRTMNTPSAHRYAMGSRTGGDDI